MYDSYLVTCILSSNPDIVTGGIAVIAEKRNQWN